MKSAYDQASSVDAVDGIVFIEGPGPLAYSMTAAAALETSEAMLRAGLKAQGQTVPAWRALRDE